MLSVNMSSVYILNRSTLPMGASDFQPTDSRYTDNALEELNNAQLFKILEEAKKEVTNFQLENFLLEDFLNKNDPKLLIGVTNALQFSHKTARIHFAGVNTGSRDRNEEPYFRARSTDRGSFSGMMGDDSSSMKTTTSFSRRAGTSVRTIESPRNTVEFRINYSMKIELAEKLCDEINEKLVAIEAKTLSEMKDLTASIQEWAMSNAEAIQSKDAFQKFTAAHLLDQINSRIPAEKFIRYINDWLKNGMALVGKIRLRLTALKQQYHSQKIILSKKADLSVILRPIDFEQLQIERSDFKKEIDEKNNHLMALKKVTGRAALVLNQNQKKLKLTESHYRKLVSEALAIEEHIARLEKEGTLVQNDLISCEESIEKLQTDIDDYVAPSTLDYVNKKHELLCLEKEMKFFKRQIYILNIKLSNARAKWRKSLTGVEFTNKTGNE